MSLLLKVERSQEVHKRDKRVSFFSMVRFCWILDEDKLFSLFKYSNERVMERMKKSFKNKAVAINDLTSKRISIEQAKEAFKKGFEEGLNINLEPYKLTKQKLIMFKRLLKNVMKVMNGILSDKRDLHFACPYFYKNRKNRNFSNIIFASLNYSEINRIPRKSNLHLLFSYIYFFLCLTKSSTICSFINM